MTAAHTATVEALTAEVRVLMVGSRQVTMSVYNQLDTVSETEIVPFGRVSPKDAERNYIYVVGASKRDGDPGSLVRAWCIKSAWLRDQAAKERSAAMFLRRRYDAATRGDHAAATDAYAEFRRLTGQCVLIEQAEKVAAEYDATANELDTDVGSSAAWEQLPLIVLAGLR